MDIYLNIINNTYFYNSFTMIKKGKNLSFILKTQIMIHMELNNKDRAYLSGLISKEHSIVQIGKEDVSPKVIKAIDEVLAKRELIKISVLKNCFSDLNELADTIKGRTNSTVVRIIGRKIILYRRAKKPKIVLPSDKVKKKK